VKMAETKTFRMPVQAVRILPAELNKALYTFKDGDEEMAPKFVLLPSGRRASRVVVAGVVTEVYKTTEQSEKGAYDRWSVRLVGPTAGVALTANTMFDGQNAAIEMLKKLPPAPFDAIAIGRPKVLGEGDDAVMLVSLEAIVPVGTDDVIDVVVEAAEGLADAILASRKDATMDTVKAKSVYGTSPEELLHLLDGTKEYILRRQGKLPVESKSTAPTQTQISGEAADGCDVDLRPPVSA